VDLEFQVREDNNIVPLRQAANTFNILSKEELRRRLGYEVCYLNYTM